MAAAIRRIINYILYSNIFVAICAVAMTFITYLRLLHPVKWDALATVIVFGTIFIYIFQRVISVTMIKDMLVNRRNSWFYGHLRSLVALALLSLVIIFINIFFISQELFIALMIIGLISLLYGIPLRVGRFFRLRDIGIMKIFIISFCWAYVTVILPIINIDYSIWDRHVLLLFVERFAFIFAITIPFDIRDRGADSTYSLNTIPRLIGNDRAMDLAYLMLVCVLVFSGFYTALTAAGNFWHWLAIGLNIGVTAIVISYAGIKRPAVYYLGMVDGMMLLQFILLLLLDLIFNS